VSGRSPVPGSGLRPEGLSQSSLSQAEPLVPNAGDVHRIPYPFVRETYSGFDERVGDYAEIPTWKPGIRNEWITSEETGTVADALGEAIFTVEAVFKPGRFPTRVFFTRQFINPDGKQFGKGRLHIVTLEKFRRLARGYQHPFGLGEPLPHYWNERKAREEFEILMAEYIASPAHRKLAEQVSA
jgi:hypothetical protein